MVNTLGAHEIWYDQRLYAGQHWWKEIIRRLEWSDIFVYLLSKDSIASPYCRKELEIARKLGRDILPILIDPEAIIPGDLQDLQYVDMSNQFDAENVSMLHNSILIYERDIGKTPVKTKSRRLQTGELHSPVIDSAEMIGKAANAFEKGEYDQVLLLLKQSEAKGFKSRFINIQKMIQAAEKAITDQTRRREAEREYRQIAELFKYESMYDFACDAFIEFEKIFPEHDPDNFKQYCVQPVKDEIVDGSPDSDFLPMLKWCLIPGGVINVSNTGSNDGRLRERSVKISSFYLSKYPVTNQQFQHFIDAQDGYANPYWWQFSDYATAWFEEHLEPLPSRYESDERPRENVNWYEAVAFTRWLSHATNQNITLPRVAQWQKAAQGDDDRFYPWGNVFHESYCNTHESEIKSTTSVDRYDKGVSPYGVYDMSGNVWEWCIDKIDPEEGSFDFRRAVLGGSFVSPADRAQVSFRYYLKPDVRYSSIGFRIVYLTNRANLINA